MSNPIPVRIAKLVEKAKASHSTLREGKLGGFEAFCDLQGIISKEMNAIDKAAGDGLVVGRKLSFSVADGAAFYFVTKVRKNDVVVEHVPYGDAWQWEGVYQNAKGELVIPRPIAERQCKASRELAAIFGE
jgi:hypothetical protein